MSLLEDTIVVEISGNGSAAWAGKHFADWGASVNVIEPPDGTLLREAPPHYEANGKRRSATWEWLSRGKTGLRDLSAREARDACSAADVLLVESELSLSVLGLEPENVREAFERKAICVLNLSVRN